MIWAILALVLTGVDQLTKYLVIQNIGMYDSINIIPHILNFVYVQNTGAAFSILENMTWLLGIISALFCICIVAYYILKEPTNRLLCISMVLMFSGALGNAIDRIFRGFVVDFISVIFVKFPVFNIADILITVGAVIFVVYIILFDKKEQA